MQRSCALIAIVLATLGGAASARAHADPTIHYLESQNLLASVGQPETPALELQLLGLVQAIEKKGYPIKLSVIADETDTGGETAQLEDPRAYAEVVVEELELFFPVVAPVVLVTPEGFGIAGKHLRDGRLQPITRAEGRALLRGIPVPPLDADALARTAMVTVRRLAEAGGRPLPAYVAPAKAFAPAPGTAGRGADGDGVDTWVWSLVLASIPLLLWALYVLWNRGERSG